MAKKTKHNFPLIVYVTREDDGGSTYLSTWETPEDAFNGSEDENSVVAEYQLVSIGHVARNEAQYLSDDPA